MARHTTFRFCLDPTVEQTVALARHVGAARFAYNQCLRLHLDARAAGGRPDKDADGDGKADRDASSVSATDETAVLAVPWSGFSLINAFNSWKRSEAAGRRFLVSCAGVAEVEVTGLAWRSEVSAQVSEEAAVDLSRGLAAWIASRSGKRNGRPIRHPRFKKKAQTGGSFRMRNKTTAGRASIRVGLDRPRSVILPRIGSIRVRENTRRLRRMIANGRARILQATITRGTRRWWISVTVEAADLHPSAQHRPRPTDDATGWVGVDRGLHALVVAGTRDGTETHRVQAPKTLATGLRQQRRLARAVARTKRGSANRRKAAARLAMHHSRVRDARQHFLHQVSNQLVKTHDRLVLEDLNITGIMSNRRLARAVADAAWGELARQITYKQHWHGGQVVVADRWFASSKTCSDCGTLRKGLTLKERTFECGSCGLVLDRDLNAAANLAAWAEDHIRGEEAQDGDRQAAGPDIKACRRDGTGPHTRVGETSPDDAGTPTQTAPAA
ncbi:putative transposase [Promicromonospora umidemergens]|uniref:IS607 family element RNA-guided endonuclease TnpB n=1 Tax=Promicromonospora umidemergens TaxID=629679 RepID=A0ABP8Y4U6_9MICO|nr:transposase [Promicromonospora umidemergens]MCP2282721.1 putative transposase [Promicromonospora umidemergens]